MGSDNVLGEENENRLVHHIKIFQHCGFPITTEDVRSLAYNFAKQLGIQQSLIGKMRKQNMNGCSFIFPDIHI